MGHAMHCWKNSQRRDHEEEILRGTKLNMEFILLWVTLDSEIINDYTVTQLYRENAMNTKCIEKLQEVWDAMGQSLLLPWLVFMVYPCEIIHNYRKRVRSRIMISINPAVPEGVSSHSMRSLSRSGSGVSLKMHSYRI